jgi:PIN domain nuclease of toxin-antitoxin system
MAIVAALQASPGFRLAPLSPDTALHIRELTALRDIHDRLIVAEAIERDAVLITRDEEITGSGLIGTVW